MPQGSNPEFLAKIGATEQLPGKLVPRQANGRFDTPRAQMGREHALDILNDPKYRENLKKRMVMGEGGAIEVWIWRIGYGEPQKDDTDNEMEKARFEAIRIGVKEFLRSHPQQANVIDAAVMGATRVLPRPMLPPPPEDDGDGRPA